MSIGAAGTVADWGRRPARHLLPPGAADGRALRGARVWWRQQRGAGAGSAGVVAGLTAGAARAAAAAAGQRPLGRAAAPNGGGDKRRAEMGPGALRSVGEGEEKVLLTFLDNVQ